MFMVHGVVPPRRGTVPVHRNRVCSCRRLCWDTCRQQAWSLLPQAATCWSPPDCTTFFRHAHAQCIACSPAGGDLLDYINAQRSGVAEDEARYIFQQLVGGS